MSTPDEPGRYPHIEDLQAASDAAWRVYFELRNAYADAYAAFMRAKDEVDRADMALMEARTHLPVRPYRERQP